MEENFEDMRTDLIGIFVEAKDNVRFLSTLERHFKNITYGVDFRVSGAGSLPTTVAYLTHKRKNSVMRESRL